ncbi:MAG: FAD-dependent oxidoreductase [Candidatus Omnitrophota bacterium]|jgi:protoporphyrinogen oxidase
MAKKKIVIAGGGLAGLSAAWHLQKKGVDCILFEKETEVGGLCRSAHVKGFTFDRCGHLFHFKYRYTFELIKDMLGDNLLEHKKSAWIYSHKRFTRYPFQANLYGLPKPVIKECLLGFIQARRNGSPEARSKMTFLDWVNQTFGKGIAEHFMIPYNRKFWTVEPEELTCNWFDGFIPVPSLKDIVESTLEENKRSIGYNAQFWYPKKGGIQEIPRYLASRIKGIHADHEISRIDFKDKKLIFRNGSQCPYGTLILTIPLPELLELMYDLPRQVAEALKQLRYNSIYNLNLGICSSEAPDKHWVYFPEEAFVFFRAGFPGNFSPVSCPKEGSSIYIEVAYGMSRQLEKNTVVARIKKDLQRAGILRAQDTVLVENINDIEYGYIIYDRRRERSLRKITVFLKKNGIECLGRYGSWSYKSMEDVLIDGKRLADSL